MRGWQPLNWIAKALGFRIPGVAGPPKIHSRLHLHERIGGLRGPASIALLDLLEVPSIEHRFGEDAAEQARKFVFSRLLSRMDGSLFRISENRVVLLDPGSGAAALEAKLDTVVSLIESYPFRIRAVERPRGRRPDTFEQLRGRRFEGPEIMLRIATAITDVAPGESAGTVINRLQNALATGPAAEADRRSSR